MSASASQWIDAIVGFLAEEGYAILGSPIGAGHLATKRVHNLGPFFPSTNYFFIHSLSGSTSPLSFQQLHAAGCAYAESQFRLPRMMRYRIPNTATIGVSGSGYSAEMIEYAQRPWAGLTYVGGEKNSAYLFDVIQGQLYSQGPEITPGMHGSQNVIGSNPNNRTFELMMVILERLLAL